MDESGDSAWWWVVVDDDGRWRFMMDGGEGWWMKVDYGG